MNGWLPENMGRQALRFLRECERVIAGHALMLSGVPAGCSSFLVERLIRLWQFNCSNLSLVSSDDAELELRDLGGC